MIQNSNSIDRILRTGLATPALVLTILAGAAFAQQGGMVGRTYEVIIENKEDQQAQRAQQDRAEVRVRNSGRARVAPQQEVENARVVIEINQIVDGQTISVRQVNDEPIVVKIDGKVIDSDHYDMKKNVVVITDPKTGRKHEVAMPERNIAAIAESPFGRLRVAEPAAPAVGRMWVQDGQVMQAPGQPRVMLGVVMAEPDPLILEQLGLSAEKTVVLERVIEGLPAAKAGLQAKDIVIGFGEHAEPRSAEDIRKILSKAEPGSTVKVKVIRKGEPHTVDLKLEAFNGEALGRANAPEAVGGAVEIIREGMAPQRWAVLEREHHDHMAQAEKALREAAEMMARMERDLAGNAADAHRKASEAIKQAIEAMQQGDLAGMEIEEMRQLQQDAVERLRRELGANRGGGQRLWAQPGEGVEGFALRFPDEGGQDNAWAERLEQLERRLGDLERNVDRALERLEARTGAMMERLINRLEESIDRLERDRK